MKINIYHRLFAVAAAVGIIASLSSCSGVKNLRKPSLDIPAETVKGYTDSLSYSDMQWWEYYTAPALKSLIARALETTATCLKPLPKSRRCASSTASRR